MNIAIIWDEAYAEHDTGAHPEGADRITTVVDYLRSGRSVAAAHGREACAGAAKKTCFVCTPGRIST